MIDPKVKTFLKLAEIHSYTKTAEAMNLTQPAVSQQIKQLEQQYNIKIFHHTRKTLKLTAEGEVLLRYAKRLNSINTAARQAVEDSKNNMTRFSVGVTTTAADFVVSKIFAEYCNRNPDVHINIITDNIKNIYSALQSYKIDWAIVEGNIPDKHYRSILLDTDYICLVAAKNHPLASLSSVNLSDLKHEKLILRSKSAGTRVLFENYLLLHSETIQNFNIVIETDNIGTIKELVTEGFGISFLAHRACLEELASGKMENVPINNFKLVRETNLVYRDDFSNMQMLHDIQKIYASNQ